ncbi:MAG: hypothetical protein ABSB74_05650 [Tepidisphaeraceae bacterium]
MPAIMMKPMPSRITAKRTSIKENADCRLPNAEWEENADCRLPNAEWEENADCRLPNAEWEENAKCRLPNAEWGETEATVRAGKLLIFCRPSIRHLAFGIRQSLLISP